MLSPSLPRILMAMDAWISRVLLLMTTRLHGIATIMLVGVLWVILERQIVPVVALLANTNRMLEVCAETVNLENIAVHSDRYCRAKIARQGDTL